MVVGHLPYLGWGKPQQLGVTAYGVEHALDGCRRLTCCESILRVVLDVCPGFVGQLPSWHQS